jgi:acetyl esterase/lipase
MKSPVLTACLFAQLFLVSMQTFAAAPETAMPLAVPLWPHGAPGRVPSGPEQTTGSPHPRLTNVSAPSLSVYFPDDGKTDRPAILVFPGGSYQVLAIDHEGIQVCKWLTSIGVTAILIRYRVPDQAPHTGPLQDAQRAMGIVRSRAREWNIDPHRIGVLGFSAGGHLAASLSNHYAHRAYTAIDEKDALDCRPDFTILIYPAYLTAKDNEGALVQDVTSSTPPTFLVQTEDDQVGVENSLEYYAALRHAKVPAEMHLFAKGGHGYGLGTSDGPVGTWPDRLQEWLRNTGTVSPAK